MAFLKIMTGDRKGQRYEIDRDEIVIGRATENVVSIIDPAISGRHCAVLRNGRVFTLKDLNSTNGTKLNQVTVKEYRLSPGDVIGAGGIDILFDGDDIEPYEPPTSAVGQQVTVRLGQPGGVPIGGFQAKKDNRMAWYLGVGIIALLALGALAWFLFRVFKASPAQPM